jgi:N-acetylgalactosamine 4-sulfate 6-O-sulfotransferase
VRNPTSRLFSDYKFFAKGKHSSEDFHDKVVKSIGWWENCVSKYPVDACAYGKAPLGLQEMGFEYCMRNKTFCNLTHMNKMVCHNLFSWTLSAADRLRVSMYDLYVKKWLEVFPRENCLILKSEEYIADPINVLENQIIPFLGLSPFTEKEKIQLANAMLHVRNSTPKNIIMLPETKALLDKFYEQTQTGLYNLLKDDRFLWFRQ